MKIRYALAAILLAITSTATVFVASSNAALPCRGTWDVVVGGLNNNNSEGFINADQRVGYNSYDTRSGVNELNRLVRDHRRACPGDWIKIVGHSGGAAVAHVWVTENGGGFGRVNAVLLADPKRPAGPGGPGFAQTDWPFNTVPPLAGADNFYSGVPVLQVCNNSDHICNSQSDWGGYMNGTHNAYDFDVNHYSNHGNGVWYRNQ